MPSAELDTKEVCLCLRFRSRFEGYVAALRKLLKSGKALPPDWLDRLEKSHRSFPPEWDEALKLLKQSGLVITSVGTQSLCVRVTVSDFTRAFSAKLQRVALESDLHLSQDFEYVLDKGRMPALGSLAKVFSAVTVLRPFRFIPSTGPTSVSQATLQQQPPFRIEVEPDVPIRLRVDRIRQQDPNATGTGIKVAIIDSGFDGGHEFFAGKPFSGLAQIEAAPNVTPSALDNFGHGTGVTANLCAVAPGVELLFVKMKPDGNSAWNPTIVEGVQTALIFEPRIISLSLISPTEYGVAGAGAPQLGSDDAELAGVLEEAVAGGVTVVCGAGNGQFAFPGQMDCVISVGGVFSSGPIAQEVLTASNAASAFTSALYPNRSIPDVCGLVGMMDHADYIRLPVQKGSIYDVTCQAFDGTTSQDGWAFFSGTSSAAPQIAGVCALLLQANPALTPAEIKDILCKTARSVPNGGSHQSTGGLAGPGAAGSNRHLATGFGLVDAEAAWKEAKARGSN